MLAGCVRRNSASARNLALRHATAELHFLIDDSLNRRFVHDRLGILARSPGLCLRHDHSVRPPLLLVRLHEQATEEPICRGHFLRRDERGADLHRRGPPSGEWEELGRA